MGDGLGSYTLDHHTTEVARLRPVPARSTLLSTRSCARFSLGATITGAAIAEELTWTDCRPVQRDPVCPTCGEPGQLRDHVERVLTVLPVRPTIAARRTSRMATSVRYCCARAFDAALT